MQTVYLVTILASKELDSYRYVSATLSSAVRGMLTDPANLRKLCHTTTITHAHVELEISPTPDGTSAQFVLQTESKAKVNFDKNLFRRQLLTTCEYPASCVRVYKRVVPPNEVEAVKELND
jgi:hypothetical protein